MNQQKKIYLLGIVFIILSITTIIIKVANNKNTTLANTKLGIDTSNVTNIQFNNSSIALENKIWYVNQQIASQNTVYLILAGLATIEEKIPLAKENITSTQNLLKEKGIKVQVKGNTSYTLYFLKHPNDEAATLYMDSAQQKPYIVHVPGFSGNIYNAFTLQEKDLRSKALFRCLPNSIELLTFTYTDKKDYSFEIKYGPQKIYEVQNRTFVQDTNMVYAYLQEYENINVNQWIYQGKENLLSVIKKDKPQISIKMVNIEPFNNKTIELYGENQQPKGIIGYIVETNELFLIDKTALAKILIRKDLFKYKQN